MPPVIHIAGTNGKGSTLAYLNALISGERQERAQLHISPSDLLSRAYSPGGEHESADISEEQLVDVLLRAQAGNAGEPITFFEITMVAAFLAFAENRADYLILETGLGGRFDATNVVDQPVLTIITPISMDHMDFLGSSLAEIAFEKAGIMKRGVPCIVGKQSKEVLDVLRERAMRN